MSYKTQDDTVLDGPWWRCGPACLPALAPAADGLIEQLTDRMQPFIALQSETLDADLRRTTVERFAPQALREAILNAFVHWDWTSPAEVEVVNYADRLQITSPGALQNPMSVEKMLAGQRSARNPLIMEVMRDYGYVEQGGMGVRRKIVPLTRALAGRDAQFDAAEDFVRVTLPAAGDEV